MKLRRAVSNWVLSLLSARLRSGAVATVVAAATVAAILMPAPASAQTFQQQQELSVPAGAGSVDAFGFGSVIDYDGNTAVVGSPDESVSGNRASGVVYVFVRSGANNPWTFQQRIPGPAAGARFGSAVAVSGDTLAVGSAGSSDRTAEVAVFLRSGSTWTRQTGGAPTGLHRTLAMQLEGDTLVVGDLLGGPPGARPGYVAIYQRVAGAWSQAALIRPTEQNNSGVGGSGNVSLSGSTLCVGAGSNAGTSAPGAAYLYSRNNAGAWTLTQRLDGALANDRFGASCAVDGDTVVVGAPARFSAFVYTQSGTTFQLQQQLTPTRLGFNGNGSTVAIAGDVVVVGSNSLVTVFGRSGTTWTERQVIDGPPNRIVVALSISPTMFAIGTHVNSDHAVVRFYTRDASGPPSAPTNVQATANGNALNMTWGAPTSGAAPTSYTLIARASAGGAVLGTAPLGNVTSFSAVAPNGVFVLSLVATNASGTGPESAGVSVTLPSLPAPPGAPTNLTSSVVGSTATLTWAAPASGGAVSNYVLAAGLTPGFAVPLGVLPLPAAPLSYAIPGIPPGTYYLRLQAQNAGGTSAASNEVTVTVAAPAAPGAPTLNAPTVSGSTVGLSWTPGGGGAPTSYVLTALTAGGVVLGSVPVTGASLSVPNVPSGSYLLRIVAVNSVGPSPVSNTVTLIVP